MSFLWFCWALCVCFDWWVLLGLGFCYCNGILISEIIASLYRQSMPYVLSFYFWRSVRSNDFVVVVMNYVLFSILIDWLCLISLWLNFSE